VLCFGIHGVPPRPATLKNALIAFAAAIGRLSSQLPSTAQGLAHNFVA
jgi:hypothetical protein